MINNKARDSLVRLSKNLGIDILTLPIIPFVGNVRVDPPAFTNENGIFIRQDVIDKEPENIEIYLAHEIFHHVIDSEKFSKYKQQHVNIATDFKINQLIEELYGYDATKVMHRGIREKKFDQLSVKDILDHIHDNDPKSHLTHCNTIGIAHPLIIKQSDRIREHIKHKLNKDYVQNPVYLDNVDLELFYESLSKIEIPSRIKIPGIHNTNAIKSTWAHAYMDSMHSIPTSKKLSHTQAVAFCIPGNRFRTFTKGNTLNSIIFATEYFKNLYKFQKYKDMKIKRMQKIISNLKINISKKNNSSFDKEKLKKMKLRLARTKTNLKKFKSIKNPNSLFLKGKKVKVLGKAKIPTKTVSLLSSDISKSFAASKYKDEVKIPRYDTKNAILPCLRMCASKALSDTKKIVFAYDALEEFRKEIEKVSSFKNEKIKNKEKSNNSKELNKNKDSDEEDDIQSGQNNQSGQNDNIKNDNQNSENIDRKKSRERSTIYSDRENKKDKNQETSSEDLLNLSINNFNKLKHIVSHMKEIESKMAKRSSRRAEDTNSINTNYMYGNDISKVVDSEIALLVDKSTEMEFFARLANHSLLMASPSKSKRTNVVICVDGSNSMKGHLYQKASAFAMILMKKLFKDKRGSALILFSDEIQAVHVVTKDKPFNIVKVLKSICSPNYGGTDFDIAIKEAFAIKSREKWNSLEIILVSDGYGVIEDQEFLKRHKTKNDRIIAALVTNASVLKGADEVYQLKVKNEVIDLVHIANNIL